MNVSFAVAFFPASDSESAADRSLIERTLEGDDDAFRCLIERFQRKIYRITRSIVQDDAEAEAITHDTFVQAYTHLSRFEQRAGLETWLTRIAINRSRDLLRRRRFVSLFRRGSDGVETMVVDPQDERPDPERQAMAAELRNAIERAERKLSPQQKLVFRLRHHENLTLDQIAAMAGLRPATARVHLFRALAKIRRELSEWHPLPRKEELR